LIFNIEHELLLESIKEHKGLIESSKPLNHSEIATDAPKSEPSTADGRAVIHVDRINFLH
jgi:hypothetical protein